MHILNSLVGLDEDDIKSRLASDVPFLITYPRHRNRTAILSLVLRHNTSPLYYFPLSTEDTFLYEMLQRLVADYQFPDDFGYDTNYGIDESNDPRDWAVGFAADLAKLRSDPYILVIDQFDYVQHDSQAVDIFFNELAQRMPPHAQIVINGRELTKTPWNDLILNGHARAIGEETAVSDGIFRQDNQQGQIEFQSLSGSTRVLSDGRIVTSWDGSLPRVLCYYFIEHQMVTRNDIFEVFWPHLGIKEATNVFHVTKRKISEKLGYEITAYSNGFYIHSPRVNVLYDAREFEANMDFAIQSETLSPSHYYRAVQLYRHEYLPDVDMPWVVAKREKLRDYFVQALIGLGRLHAALGERNRSLCYYNRALSERPDREDVHRNIMQIHADAGHIRLAIEQYQRLEKTLKQKFNITPSQDSRSMYEALRALL
ncbi:MAG: hypothetical protein H6673_16650 [Anaerolineales bacterium]|nr:hypothetical protein [Anaerolineales bacterium]